MKILLLIATYACCGILQTNPVQAQHSCTKQQLSDTALFALESKYLHTPVTKITRSNGDVFLQRNMDEYLGATVFKNRNVVAPDHDFGDDHNSQQLAAFLNRPHPSTATLMQYF